MGKKDLYNKLLNWTKQKEATKEPPVPVFTAFGYPGPVFQIKCGVTSLIDLKFGTNNVNAIYIGSIPVLFQT